ncbi:P-type conjugative transfer protein TrbG [Sphingomonas sp. JC676]|uniref:P-type conjugative transfer protein TrbG n=1 Tax=Sphingomonas sp. JC676 TaxID=2768065 RepID=UPI001657F37B|nr:P-type conjugative transfer protein TrbG [Sphingomonas sp. JC676]MBC9030846.1 P-type conjugative transfer protein TrbG [Sphingomonas sp. JC676]
MIRFILLSSACLASSPALAQHAPDRPIVPAASPRAQGNTVEPADRERPAPRSRTPRRQTVRHARARTPIAQVDSATRAALLEPSSHGYVNAVQVYPWTEGSLYRLYAAPELVTDVALEPGETLTAIAAGDTVRWTVGDTTSGSGAGKRTHILVKPFSAGLKTNLVVTTDRRSYHLQLESTAATAMAAISWTYAPGALLAFQRSGDAQPSTPVAAGIAIDRLRFGYTIDGDRPDWRPLRAFDDGQQTFIEFPATLGQGEAPPLFVIGDDGAAQLVNYRQRGNFYVVDRLFNAAELRLGTKRQLVVRITREGSAKHKGKGA